MTSKIFISYRRDDSSGSAGRVHDRLEREFGRDLLFMDVDGIPLGVNFIKVLREEVAKCDVLLAVIGANWLNARNEDGDRRLDNPSDFVRVEIATALSRDIPVIPILLDGTRIPKSEQLPQELQELAARNALDVRHTSFHVDMDRLVSGLKSVLDPVVVPVLDRPAEDGTRQKVRTPTPTVGPAVVNERLEDDLRMQVAELRARGLREQERLHDQKAEQQPVPAETEQFPPYIYPVHPSRTIKAAAEDENPHQTTAAGIATSAPSRTQVAIVIAVMIAGGAVAILKWSMFAEKPPVASNSAAATPTTQKSRDQGTQEQSAAPPLASKTAPADQASSATMAMATATLYEEDSKNPQGLQYPGTAIWTTEKLSPGPVWRPNLPCARIFRFQPSK